MSFAFFTILGGLVAHELGQASIVVVNPLPWIVLALGAFVGVETARHARTARLGALARLTLAR